MTTPSRGYSLAHPVYLDIPMMTSFLAHLEGGVSVSEEETKTSSGARERALSAKAGMRFKLWAIADAEVGSEGKSQSSIATASESKTERHHTAASLFNLLYEYLKEDDQLIELSDPDQLDELRAGQLVELSGEYLGNPIEDVLAFIGSLYPYIDQEAQGGTPNRAPAPGSRSSRPAKRATARTADAPTVDTSNDEAIGLVMRMLKDIEKAPVHDLLFDTISELKAVVTVASEYYSATTNEHLREGEFRIVGKVTKVVTGGKSIDLTRRTVLGAAGPGMAQGIIGSVAGTDGLSLRVADPIVNSPAVQILPMAIFI